MPTTPRNKPPSEKEPDEPIGPLAEHTDEQSSPGSGEDEDGAADLQPEDIDDDDTAR